MAVRHGASALGLVSEMPSGPGVIPDELIAEIALTVPPGVSTFLLTSQKDPETIIGQVRASRVNTVQLVERMTVDSRRRLRESLPGIALVQVVHVSGLESVQEARAAANDVDALLLDTGNHDLRVKVLGGTGRVHDWQISEAINTAVDVPVFLAGGLNSENVREGIEAVRPFAVDACSGLRTSGHLDKRKLTAFMAAVSKASG